MSRPTDNRTVTDWSETEEINTENDATSSGKGKNERSLLFEATLFVWNFPEVRVPRDSDELSERVGER